MNINNPMIFNKLRQIYDEKSTFSELEGKRYIQTPEGQIQLTGTLGDWFVKKHIAKLSKEYLESSKYKRSKRQNDSPPSLPLVTSKPQISYTQLKPTDAYLLLGSNGRFAMIQDFGTRSKKTRLHRSSRARKRLRNILPSRCCRTSSTTSLKPWISPSSLSETFPTTSALASSTISPLFLSSSITKPSQISSESPRLPTTDCLWISIPANNYIKGWNLYQGSRKAAASFTRNCSR